MPQDIDQAISELTELNESINPIYVKSVFTHSYGTDFKGCKKLLTVEMLKYLIPSEYKNLL